jgi:hypothetical protein
VQPHSLAVNKILEVVMSKRKKVKRTATIVFVFSNSNKKETEPSPDWADVVAFAESIEQPLSVLWPHRAVRKDGRYKKWGRHASVLRRLVLFLKAGLPISPGLKTAFYEVKRQEERARHVLLEKAPPRKRGC